MHFSNLIATFGVASLAAAHGMEGVPRIFGRHNIAELKNRNAFNAEKSVAGPDAKPAEKKRALLESRQNTDGQCGAGYGSCAAGYCCSSAGWCGKGREYCAAPDCQFNYGPGCDANQTPPGTNTSSVSRTRLGSVLYGGAGIYDCVTANTIALTYDDGPYIYTDGMLDVLKSYGAKATFFITGNNLGKGEIDNAYYGWNTVINRMATEGHQVASHTWSHQDLSTLTSAQRKNQMYKNEMALRNILGYFPTYMRPPYSSCNSACQTDLYNLGYHIAYFDVDTDDYNQDSPLEIQNSKDWFLGNISTGADDYLVIAHDIHQQTAQNLTAYMLQVLQQKGYKAVTLGECLGDPSTNWYRSSSGSVFTSAPASSATTTSTTTSAAVSATAISTTGQCGGSTGLTCQGSEFGNCCSPAGWCGSSSAYCGTGCQSAFGSCGTSTSTTTTTSAAASATAVSTDGSCGGASRFTCQGSSFGNCCSQYGWCGSSSDYCGTGCQASFGTCS